MSIEIETETEMSSPVSAQNKKEKKGPKTSKKCLRCNTLTKRGCACGAYKFLCRVCTMIPGNADKTCYCHGDPCSVCGEYSDFCPPSHRLC